MSNAKWINRYIVISNLTFRTSQLLVRRAIISPIRVKPFPLNFLIVNNNTPVYTVRVSFLFVALGLPWV